jgi:uncharacterized protein YbjT (DUF2867 family)
MTRQTTPLILLTGGTGTTGRRIAQRLRSRDVAVRCASRTGTPPFDWDRPDTWTANLDGVSSVYIAYSPDLAMPGAVDVEDIADVAVAALLSADHDGHTYDVTGPRLMTFTEAAHELAVASRRPVEYLHVAGGEFVAAAIAERAS